MELRTVDGVLKLSGAFKVIATGFAVGAGVIFVPAFVLITIATVAIGGPINFNGETVEGKAQIFAALAPIFMAPFMIVMQSVMIGGLTVFGLWLYQKRRPIRVINEDAGR